MKNFIEIENSLINKNEILYITFYKKEKEIIFIFKDNRKVTFFSKTIDDYKDIKAQLNE